MTEMGDAIIFVGFWRPQCPPPPSPDATILNYLNDRERRATLSFVGFCRPPMTPPPPQTSQYLTILLTGGGGAPMGITFCRILAPQCPPSLDPTILNYLNNREGVPLSFVGCWRPPPPFPKTPQYLTILMTTGRRGPQISCKKLNIHV